MAVGDRVWLEVAGPNCIYYVATIVRTYEHPVEPSDPAHFRWRTDIRFHYRLRPPLFSSTCSRTSGLDRSARSGASRARTCGCRRVSRRPWRREPHRASSPWQARTGKARAAGYRGFRGQAVSAWPSFGRRGRGPSACGVRRASRMRAVERSSATFGGEGPVAPRRASYISAGQRMVRHTGTDRRPPCSRSFSTRSPWTGKAA